MKNLFQRIFGTKNKALPGQASLMEEQEEMKQGIEDLPQTVVKEIMVPRTDVAFINEAEDIEELVKRIKSTGHSRYPVYSETIDKVIGILYVKELLTFLGKDIREIQFQNTLKKPYFVPETMKLDALLREMKKRHVHIAVVVDEYGGVSGIVCMEDILEEIIGDIQDEFDNEREDIIPIGEHIYLCDARTSIEDINDQLGLNLPNNQFDTLGGYVFDLFGRIPSRFEKIRHENIDFITQDMEGYKVKSIKLVIHQEGSNNVET